MAPSRFPSHVHIVRLDSSGCEVVAVSIAGSDSKKLFIKIEQYSSSVSYLSTGEKERAALVRVSDESGVVATKAEFATNVYSRRVEGM